MRKIVLCISLLLAAVYILFFGCTLKNNKMRDNDHASQWLNRLQVPYLSIEKYNVEEVAFTLLPSDQKSEYISRLADVQYVELEEDEYLGLTKKNLVKNYGLAVRAVYTHKGGNFSVTRNNKNGNNILIIHYMVMGAYVSEINKDVLIVEIDELPEEIFIGYTTVK